MVAPLIAAAAITAAGSIASSYINSKNQGTTTIPGTKKTKEETQLMKQVIEGVTKGTGPFADLFGKFNEEEFNDIIGKPALKQFQEETLPMLQEKFIAENQVLGSGLQRASTKAAGDFQTKLAQLMYQAKQDKDQNKIDIIKQLVGSSSADNIVKEKEKSGLQGALSGAIPGITQAATNYFAQGNSAPTQATPSSGAGMATTAANATMSGVR